MKKILILALITMFCSSCSEQTNQVVTTEVVEKEVIKPNLPEQIQISQVNFILSTKEDLILLTQQKNIVLYTLTPEQMTNLTQNIQEMYRYISQLKQTVIYYQNIYESKSPIKPKNKS